MSEEWVLLTVGLSGLGYLLGMYHESRLAGRKYTGEEMGQAYSEGFDKATRICGDLCKK